MDMIDVNLRKLIKRIVEKIQVKLEVAQRIEVVEEKIEVK